MNDPRLMRADNMILVERARPGFAALPRRGAAERTQADNAQSGSLSLASVNDDRVRRVDEGRRHRPTK
jgi:hypothetical protein